MSEPIAASAEARARADYERWLRSAHRGAHSRRTAERNAAFFLPHLKPGMSLMDAGCGGGSITLGLAAAVAPGMVTGIDIDAASIEAATALAHEHAVANVRFEVGDVTGLPFEGGSFDAVFAHALFQHLPSPETALRELHRLLRPGGAIGLADADFDGAIFYPDDPLLARSTEILVAVRERGDPRIGKRLRALLQEAGFDRITGSAVAGVDGDPLTIAANGRFWSEYFAAQPFVGLVEALHIISVAPEMAAISKAWRAWAAHPGAFAARFWCQAVGFKPA